MNRKSNAIIIRAFLLSLLISFLSCGSRDETISKNSYAEENMQMDLRAMYSEWNKCKNREVSPGFQVAWKIKVTDISSFGGLYGRGYIYKNKHCKLHLTWDPESELSKFVRSKIAKGSIVITKGTFEGISEKGEIIIDVKSMEIIKKGWLRTLLPFW